MKSPVLVLGATSTIAREIAYALSKKGYPLVLTGRDSEELQKLSRDVAIRSDLPAPYFVFNAEDVSSCHQMVDNVLSKHQKLSGVVSAFGYLGDQQQAEKDPNEALKIMQCNYVGTCLILDACANHFVDKKEGWIIGLSSVAGDRGRQSNYLYGSAKGAVNLFLQGLRNRLHTHGIKVITVKLGFVDTKMTFGKSGMFLVASPKDVGSQIADLPEKNSDVVYLPRFWRYIMGVIKLIPETLFKRLKL